MTKICKTCQVEKDITCFSPQTQDGITRLRLHCKPCRSKANTPQAARWRRENKDKIREAAGRRKQTLLKKRRDEYNKYLQSKGGGV